MVKTFKVLYSSFLKYTYIMVTYSYLLQNIMQNLLFLFNLNPLINISSPPSLSVAGSHCSICSFCKTNFFGFCEWMRLRGTSLSIPGLCMYVLCFCTLNIMISMSTNVVPNDRILFFYRLNSHPFCLCMTFLFLHPFTDGHGGWCHILATENNTAVNTGMLTVSSTYWFPFHWTPTQQWDCWTTW